VLRTPVGIIPVGVLAIVGIGGVEARARYCRPGSVARAQYWSRTLLPAHATDRLTVFDEPPLLRLNHVVYNNFVEKVQQARQRFLPLVSALNTVFWDGDTNVDRFVVAEFVALCRHQTAVDAVQVFVAGVLGEYPVETLFFDWAGFAVGCPVADFECGFDRMLIALFGVEEVGA